MHCRIQYIYTPRVLFFTPLISFFFENRTSSNRHETFKQPAADTAAYLANVLPCSPNKNRVQKFNIFCHNNDTHIHTSQLLPVSSSSLLAIMIMIQYPPFIPLCPQFKGRMTCTARKRRRVLSSTLEIVELVP